jgi:hypothetical protein
LIESAREQRADRQQADAVGLLHRGEEIEHSGVGGQSGRPTGVIAVGRSHDDVQTGSNRVDGECCRDVHGLLEVFWSASGPGRVEHHCELGTANLHVFSHHQAADPRRRGPMDQAWVVAGDVFTHRDETGQRVGGCPPEHRLVLGDSYDTLRSDERVDLGMNDHRRRAGVASPSD